MWSVTPYLNFDDQEALRLTQKRFGDQIEVLPFQDASTRLRNLRLIRPRQFRKLNVRLRDNEPFPPVNADIGKITYLEITNPPADMGAVLARTSCLETLILHEVASDTYLDLASYCPQLRRLELSGTNARPQVTFSETGATDLRFDGSVRVGSLHNIEFRRVTRLVYRTSDDLDLELDCAAMAYLDIEGPVDLRIRNSYHLETLKKSYGKLAVLRDERELVNLAHLEMHWDDETGKPSLPDVLPSLVHLHIKSRQSVSNTVPFTIVDQSCPELRELVVEITEADDVVVDCAITNEFVQLRRLDLVNFEVVRNVQAVENLPYLQDLTIDNAAEIPRTMCNLVSLVLKRYAGELGNLAYLGRLENLELTEYGGSGMCIGHVRTLRRLVIDSCTFTDGDYSFLAELSRLEVLKAQGYNATPWVYKADDIFLTHEMTDSPLVRLQSLRELDLSFSQLTDLRSLGSLPNLRTLIVNHCPRLHSLRGVEEFTNLEHLEFAGSPITDWSRLESLRNLDYVGVSAAQRDRRVPVTQYTVGVLPEI